MNSLSLILESKMEGHAHNDMLSPYSNTVLRKSQSKSPRRPDDETKTCGGGDMLENDGGLSNKNRELTDYLVNRQSIDYPKLMGDAIAKVDELLIKACKKEGQVGGMHFLGLSYCCKIEFYNFHEKSNFTILTKIKLNFTFFHEN